MLIENTEETSRKAICDLFGITSNNFQKLKEAGVFRPRERGVYDLREALGGWLKYHLDGAAPGDLTEARRLLAIAQKEKVLLDIKERERELLPLQEAQAVFDQTMVMVGAQLDGLAGRMAGELAGISDAAEVRAVLFNETRRIRDEAARTLTDWVTGTPGGGPAEPATTENGGSVGG